MQCKNYFSLWAQVDFQLWDSVFFYLQGKYHDIEKGSTLILINKILYFITLIN